MGKITQFSIVSYRTLEEVQEVLRANANKIRHYAYIKHDKDTDENGVLRDTHFHILLNTKNANTYQGVNKWFNARDQNANTFTQRILDKESAFDYLTHKNDVSKYQYEDSEIKTDSIDYWKNQEKEDTVVSIINDIQNGKKLKDLYPIYGKDLVYHYKDIMFFIREMNLEESRKDNENVGRKNQKYM